MYSAEIAALLKSLAFCASLIVGLGPTNIFVIRQGIRRNCVGLAVLGSVIVDLLMIALSLFSLGAIIARVPELQSGLLLLATAYISVYAFRLLRSATVPSSEFEAEVLLCPRQVFLTSLSFGLVNPYVWLDMLVLVGGFIQNFEPELRAWAALGACLASLIWFPMIGYGAASLRPVIGNPKVLRGLEIGSAGVLAWTLLGMWN